MDKVVFISEYIKNSSRRLACSPSISYAEYIVDAIKNAGFQIEIISTSGAIGTNYFTQSKVKVDSKESHLYFASLNSKRGEFFLRISQFFIFIQLLFYILFKIKPGVRILIYHSPSISYFFKLVKKFIKRNYYYVVGEVYSAVYNEGENKINQEINLLKGAKGYVFANTLLNKYFNSDNYIVVHGDYRTGLKSEKCCNSNCVNIVYAGKIACKHVTDAFIAAQTAKYLSSKYHLYILGYGDDEDIIKLKTQISEINDDRGFDVVSYEGCLSGIEYEKFLMKCSIGLCTRTLDDRVSCFCFPSKAVVYLSHGIIPICPNLAVLKHSYVNEQLVYIDGALSPENVANAIMRIDSDLADRSLKCKILINNLDSLLAKSIVRLFY